MRILKGKKAPRVEPTRRADISGLESCGVDSNNNMEKFRHWRRVTRKSVYFDRLDSKYQKEHCCEESLNCSLARTNSKEKQIETV
jgi:hypothetical protein